MSLIVYIYPHQGIASFHPTSKDSLCGAHGRRNGSMHLCHIYCKIKQQIHGDNKSHKLIKIVHMCRRWKWNTPFMDLSLLYLDNMMTCLYYYRFFFLDLHVSNYFLTLGPSCAPIFFWVLLLGHAIFFLPCPIWMIIERERSLNMEFYFVDEWNGVANFQCRSLACGVHVTLIKQVWKTSH